MKNIITLTLLLTFILCCSAQNSKCPSTRANDLCSSTPEAVCGVRTKPLETSNGLKSLWQTYINHCNACKDPTIDLVASGPCEAYESNGTFCDPSQQSTICTKQYQPVCGKIGSVFFLCRGGPCVQTFSNGCSACASGAFFHAPGACASDSSSNVEEEDAE